ncbi:rhodanese-like domain-containing protein [Mycolicibacterium alvei]|uniref:rhodanese-like domain-containing protein n=1 Tax=Mycolicibacterium alvei TaxID=67081 RepID=UPI0021F2E152|nr:rhodanese-like domain-containing protein [Mycolicibacterium alvei]MCV7000078.1 hypothetical protein [Mycolicibacterium alvei]
MNSIFYRFVKWIPLGRVGEIHPEAVNGLIESDPSAIQLVDVRSQTEWRSGHLRGAVNIPITELASRIGDLDFDKEVLLVPICCPWP